MFDEALSAHASPAVLLPAGDNTLPECLHEQIELDLCKTYQSLEDWYGAGDGIDIPVPPGVHQVILSRDDDVPEPSTPACGHVDQRVQVVEGNLEACRVLCSRVEPPCTDDVAVHSNSEFRRTVRMPVLGAPQTQSVSPITFAGVTQGSGVKAPKHGDLPDTIFTRPPHDDGGGSDGGGDGGDGGGGPSDGPGGDDQDDGGGNHDNGSWPRRPPGGDPPPPQDKDDGGVLADGYPLHPLAREGLSVEGIPTFPTHGELTWWIQRVHSAVCAMSIEDRPTVSGWLLEAERDESVVPFHTLTVSKGHPLMHVDGKFLLALNQVLEHPRALTLQCKIDNKSSECFRKRRCGLYGRQVYRMIIDEFRIDGSAAQVNNLFDLMLVNFASFGDGDLEGLLIKWDRVRNGCRYPVPEHLW